MSVTLDAIGGTPVFTAANTTLTFSSLTIGTGNCLVIMFASNTTPVFTGVTWGAQSLPLTPTVQSLGSGTNANVWVLLNPTRGNQNAVLTWVTSSTGLIWAASFKNVASFTSSTSSGTGSTASYSIGSALGHLALDLAENNSGDWASSGGGVQTQILLDNSSGNLRMGSSYEVDQSTASFSWSTAGGSVPWASVMLDFVPTAGGISVPKDTVIIPYALPDW